MPNNRSFPDRRPIRPRLPVGPNVRRGGRLAVLYEDNHLLAVNKPTGLATIGVSAARPSLAKQAKAYLKQRYRKAGNVYLGVMSRLDADVSGVVVLARTSKAAARLTEQFRTRSVQKVYWAIVSGAVRPASGSLVDRLSRDEPAQRMAVDETGGGLEARLRYRRLAAHGDLSLLEIELETGRKHQIRAQLAARGWPIVGDRKYGSRRTFPHGIALHAARLQLTHPVQHEPVHLVAPLPNCWPRWAVLGCAEALGAGDER